jgi:GIY-YIG catalytic domain
VFCNMSKIRERNYWAITKSVVKPVQLISLKGVPGIYMITNEITKKFYIGMSTNLYQRFNNYLNVDRLRLNRSSRINKALLKYGFENFSITILELPSLSSTSKKDMY